MANSTTEKKQNHSMTKKEIRKMKLEQWKEERAREEAARELCCSSKKIGHERNQLIVCASATYEGHYDPDGMRQVYVDGLPYGMATPWAVIGLPSGYHSVYIEYTERVSGTIYRWQTSTAAVCADEESVVLYAKKNGTKIYPIEVCGISSLDKIIKYAEHDGAPAPPL